MGYGQRQERNGAADDTALMLDGQTISMDERASILEGGGPVVDIGRATDAVVSDASAESLDAFAQHAEQAQQEVLSTWRPGVGSKP
jgi:hypothetical protein